MSNSKCTISAFLKHSTDVWGGFQSRNNKFKNGNKKIGKAEKMSCGPVLTSEAQSEIKGNKAF